MVLYFPQLHPFQGNTLSAGSTIFGSGYDCLILLDFKDVSWTAVNQSLCILLMVEGLIDLNIGHQPVKTGRNRRPFGMLLTNTFFSIDLQINLLVFPQFGNQNIIVQNLDLFNLGMVLRQELYIP